MYHTAAHQHETSLPTALPSVGARQGRRTLPSGLIAYSAIDLHAVKSAQGGGAPEPPPPPPQPPPPQPPHSSLRPLPAAHSVSQLCSLQSQHGRRYFLQCRREDSLPLRPPCQNSLPICRRRLPSRPTTDWQLVPVAAAHSVSQLCSIQVKIQLQLITDTCSEYMSPSLHRPFDSTPVPHMAQL